MKILSLTCLAIMSATAALAAPTSFTNAFDGGLDPRWASDSQYKLTQAGGVVRVDVEKYAAWASFGYALPEPIDIKANPHLRIRLKTDKAFVMKVYVVDGPQNWLMSQRVFPSEEFHDVYFNFSSATNVDLTKVNAIYISANGEALTYSGTFYLDHLEVGTTAIPCANISAVAPQVFAAGKTGYKVRLTDLQNVASISVGGPYTLVQNVQAGPIQNGAVVLTMDAKAGVSGTETITLAATGTAGFASVTRSFTVTVEGNAAPAMDAPAPLVLLLNEPFAAGLTGITDGDRADHQDLAITATLDNPALASGGVTIEHTGDSSVGRLLLTPTAAGTTTLRIQLTDDGVPARNATVAVPVAVYESINRAPTIDTPARVLIASNRGAQTIELTGISDGDQGTQTLSISAVSETPGIIANPVEAVLLDGGRARLTVTPNPAAPGFATLTVTIADNGGAAGNNGDASRQVTLSVETSEDPITSFVGDTTKLVVGDAPGEWIIEGRDASGNYKDILPSVVQKDGAPAWRFQAVNKFTWTGVWLNLPNMDITANPRISYEIFIEPGAFPSIDTHAYFWDDAMERNAAGAHAARQSIPAGAWRTFIADYASIKDGLTNDAGELINTARIQKVLINFHSAFSWPFTSESFTVYIRNLRVGEAAATLPRTPNTAVAAVADQVHYAGASTQRSVLVGGLANGSGGLPAVSVTSSNTAVASAPGISAPTADGIATLTYTTGATAGKATLTVTTSAPGANPASTSFDVHVIADSPAAQVAVQVDTAQRFQTIHGFGTYLPRDSYLDLYTNDLGASAMRLGIVTSQIEPVNDNNDPLVLNRDGLNKDAFDWNLLRRYKAAGVETFILTVWSPPAWMKVSLAEDYFMASLQPWESTINKLDTYYNEEYAEMLVAAVRLFEEQAGIELSAIGPQNEPGFNEPYPSAILSPAAFANLVAVIGRRFEQERIGTRIFMPEQVFSQGAYSMAEYMTAVQAHPEANRYTGIIATHGYADDGVGAGQPDFTKWTQMWSQAQAGAYPKELWMTETYPENNGYDSAFNYALFLHGALVSGNVGLWTSWSIDGQLTNRGRKLEQFQAFKHFSKFIRPGAERAAAVSANADVFASGYFHDGTQTLTCVVINDAPVPKVVRLGGAGLPPVLRHYVTSRARDFEDRGVLTGGTVVLPPRSFATITGSFEQATEPPAITSAAVADATVGAFFTYAVTATNSPLSFSATGLPQGLEINTATGVISGTPAAGAAGQYTVTLGATNAIGTGQAALALTVAARVNVPPVARIAADPLSGEIPLPVSFSAAQSSDSDGSVAGYEWDFGDGGTAQGMTAFHTFETVANHVVTLTVTDNDGGTASTTVTVSALPVPVFTFTPASFDIPYTGRRLDVDVGTVPAGAAWLIVASDPDAINFITNPPAGNGSGRVILFVRANPGYGERVIELSIRDTVLPIRQAGKPMVNPWLGIPLTGDYRYTDLGWAYDAHFPWVYLFDDGWCWVVPTGDGNYYLYVDGEPGEWWWVNPDWYPDIYYSYGSASWVVR